MKKLLLSFITATLLSSMSAGSAGAQELPEQKETLATIIKVNDYFMKKYADYTLPSFFGRVRPSNIWTRGVYYEGLIALYSIYPREDYYSYTYDWANFHKWGMRNGNTTRNADDQCCGQVYIDLYNMCPSDPNMIRNIKASIDMVVNTPQVNDWDWIDAIQMAMPIYAKFGKMTGEQKYMRCGRLSCGNAVMFHAMGYRCDFGNEHGGPGHRRRSERPARDGQPQQVRS